MNRYSLILSLLVMLPSLAIAQGTNAPPAPLPSIVLPPELDRVLRDYERGWPAGDATALADLFADAAFVPRSGGRAPGRKLIERVELTGVNIDPCRTPPGPGAREGQEPDSPRARPSHRSPNPLRPIDPMRVRGHGTPIRPASGSSTSPVTATWRSATC